MLKTNKTTTINGNSVTADGQHIASMYYSIDGNGNVNSNTNIVNTELYEQNKDTVRADVDEFTTLCRNIEDEGAAE